MLESRDPGVVSATFCATLVDEWARAGITDAVVCPGSRSTSLALALATDERIRVHVHPDERSAGFIALGLGVATGRPAVVLTTSGTAAVELHPAVVEAHQSGVPLLAVTADRPPDLRDVGAPQTIDQTRLFGSAVRWFADPGPPEMSAVGSWRSLAARAVLECTGPVPGPVHLNLPFREPLMGVPEPPPPGRERGLPWHDRVEASVHVDQRGAGRIADYCRGRSGVIVAGEGIANPEEVLLLGRVLGWPVVADPRSGCRRPDPVVVAYADAILRTPVGARLRPETVLRMGGLPASKVVNRWLADSGAFQVMVGPVGVWSDPAHDADLVVAAEPGRLALELAPLVDGHATSAWLDAWHRAEAGAAAAIADALAGHVDVTEPGVAREVLASLPGDASLVVSSSMPIRDIEWYGSPRDGVRVLANRGANGIDGVVSTAVGVALAGGPVAVLLGDLAFLHDSNGLLGAVARGIDLTVVVIDNDGGGIFSFLPQAGSLPSDRFEQLFGTPHGVDLPSLAAAHGVPSVVVDKAEAVAPALADAGAAGGVHLIVARTERAANVTVHDELHAAVAAALA